MSQRSKKRWFWAWTVLQTIPKAERENPNARSEIWKNLILVQGKNEIEAAQKAIAVGKSQQGDCRGTLTLFGKPAVTIFLGLADLGLIHEEMVDGVEILWQLKFCKNGAAKKLVQNTRFLLNHTKEELSHSAVLMSPVVPQIPRSLSRPKTKRKRP